MYIIKSIYVIYVCIVCMYIHLLCTLERYICDHILMPPRPANAPSHPSTPHAEEVEGVRECGGVSKIATGSLNFKS